MRPTMLPVLLLLALLAALTACGGSGSSGFDITPLAENAVIDEALASGQCGDSGGLHICPAATSPQSGPGTPVPTPNGVDVQLGVPESDSVQCSPSPSAPICVFTLTFVSSGLPADAIYRVAVRNADDDGAWAVGEPAVLAGSAFTVPIDLPADGARVQVAVLVFTAGNDTVSGSVQALAETGAAFAFVSADLAASPSF